MRRQVSALLALCVALAVCGDAVNDVGALSAPTPTRATIPRPLVERELAALLLDSGQLADLVAAPTLIVTANRSSMADNSDVMAPRQCLLIDGAAEAAVYAGSGFRAERDQSLSGDGFRYYVKQAVVLFPDLARARRHFDAVGQRWTECRQYTHTQTATRWRVEEITRSDDILGAVVEQQDAGRPGWRCGRALAQRNNVLIDVNTCSADPGTSAVRIAELISQRVLARW